MALMHCADCGARVSSAAGACPKCNAPPSQFRPPGAKRPRPPYAIAVGSAIAGSVLTLVAVVGYGLYLQVSKAQADNQAVVPTINPDRQQAERQAARGRANYVATRNGEYGYRMAADKTGQSLVYIRYLGTLGGLTSFVEARPDKTTVFTCAGLCESVTAEEFVNGRSLGKKSLQVDGGSLLYAVIEDITQERVKPYVPPKT